MILHPIIDLLKRIVIALPDYAGGGGELPEGMTNTVSGEIIFASRQNANTIINTGWEFTPKLLLIWTYDDLDTSNDMEYCSISRLLINNIPTKSLRFLTVRSTGSADGVVSETYNSTDVNLFITDTGFNIGHGSRWYAAGATYYWFAFD